MQHKYSSMTNDQYDQSLDQQFVEILLKIEARYHIFSRHAQIRIQKWVEKLLQYDLNTVWRKSRNNYIFLLNSMVQNGKISWSFLKMPPQKDLPNLTDSELRKIMNQLRISPKPEHNMFGVSIRKIQHLQGDQASGLNTPNCQTERQMGHNKQMEGYNKSECTQKGKQTSQIFLQKLNHFLSRHESNLEFDPEYKQLIEDIDNMSGSAKINYESKSQSAQLRVSEGIQLNKANLFQFGSPRGMTQMQYFRAALQL